jgi:isopenicillin-N N-acyltransferase-like protein
MNQLTVLEAHGSAAVVGHAHGDAFAEDIRAYLRKRRTLSAEGTDLGPDGITAIAERMVEAHRAYDEVLFEEMVAMAEAAGITPAEAIIVGGYTDFIDTVRAVAHGTMVEDQCTAVLTPAGVSGGAGYLAQTWDMHASATPHVFLLDVAVDDRPRALVFTTHGTLGQIGINEAGIAVGINNLTVDDGRYGVTWPFVVRKALTETTFDAALSAIVDAPLAGGHNFLLMDAHGRGASIEATPTTTWVEPLEDRPVVHTNHCVVPETQAVEGARPEALQENSIRRLTEARDLLAATPEHTTESLMALLRDERSICRHPEPPYDYESSGAVIMRPATGDFWGCWGVPSENEFSHHRIGPRRG